MQGEGLECEGTNNKGSILTYTNEFKWPCWMGCNAMHVTVMGPESDEALFT